LEIRTHVDLSHHHELLLRLRWLSVLSGCVPCSYAVSGGVYTAQDAVKAILCGAHAVKMVSALLRHGPGWMCEVRESLGQWMRERGYGSLAQLRGGIHFVTSPDPRTFERANYMRVLQAYRAE
jgi:dihydroorotate dehydrogenase (fumarate)